MRLSSQSILSAVLLSLAMTGTGFSQDAKKKKAKPVEVAAVRPEVLRSKVIPEGWLLRDKEGRELQAHLLSVSGENVLIQRVEDEREFSVPIENFDARSENVIRNWMYRDPDAIDYSLDIKADRGLVESTSFKIAGREFTTSKWSYTVSISNNSRNELSDAEIEYRIVYDDQVGFTRTSVMPGAGSDQQEGEKVDLPPMKFNDELEFDTPVLETHKYEYVPTKGEREFHKDSVKGIWVRIMRRGEVIAEYKSNEASMGSLSWDNEAQEEIQFRYTFGGEEIEPELD